VYPTPAIVIGRLNLGEADRILTLLTPDYGKLRVSIRGVRKIKSRLAGHVELFSQTTLMLAKGKNLDVVTSAEMVRSVDGLLDRPERLDLAYLMATMFDRLSLEGEAQPELYALADEFLLALDGEADPRLLELGLKLRLLATLGYQPELNHCVICHRSDASSRYYLSPERGGLVDETCGVAGGYRFDQKAIKLWRLAVTVPLVRLSEIDGASDLARDSLDLCDQFYEYHFGRRFNGGLIGVS
jgi:DNA repair protein RecO (recombination protein O)